MKVMIEDFTISYISNGIKTNLTIEDEHYDNMPYKLADMFAKVVNYPQTKDLWASDFIEECPFKRLGLLSSLSV